MSEGQVHDGRLRGSICGLAAAALFGLSTPLAKLNPSSARLALDVRSSTIWALSSGAVY